MKNELTAQPALSFAEVRNISEAFAASGMFPDTKSAAQAIVKVQAGQEIGIPPFQAMTGIHIVSGKPTIGAGLMASRVKGSGKYDYKVLVNTDRCCEIDFLEREGTCWKKLGSSSFTIEEAKKAGTKNMDRFPRNMLFARAISNGVRWYCPDVFSGPVYTPEEFDQPTQDVAHEVVESRPSAPAAVTHQVAPAAAAPVPQVVAAAVPAPQHAEVMDADEVPAYEWYAREVAKAKDTEMLSDLYSANAEDIAGDEAIVALFSKRKLKLMDPEAHAAKFKVIYPEPAKLLEVLAETEAMGELSGLYYKNLELIERNTEVKAHFAGRKRAISAGTAILGVAIPAAPATADAQTEKEVANA